MQPLLRRVVPLVAILAAGCAKTIDRIHDGFNGVSDLVGNVYAARSLELSYQLSGTEPQTMTTFPNVGVDHQMDFLTAAIEDSQRNCNRFLATISTGRALKDTTFDIAAIITSGLAAVFVPTLTVRALAAASSLIQGTNASIDANFFQQLSLVVFAKKIEATYMTEIKEFRRTHSSSLSGNFGIAIADLLDIHRKCSIVYAATQLTEADPRTNGGSVQRVLGEGDLTNNAILKDRNGRYWLVSVNGVQYSATQSDAQGKPLANGGKFGPTTLARLRQSLASVSALPSTGSGG